MRENANVVAWQEGALLLSTLHLLAFHSRTFILKLKLPPNIGQIRLKVKSIYPRLFAQCCQCDTMNSQYSPKCSQVQFTINRSHPLSILTSAWIVTRSPVKRIVITSSALAVETYPSPPGTIFTELDWNDTCIQKFSEWEKNGKEKLSLYAVSKTLAEKGVHYVAFRFNAVNRIIRCMGVL